MCHISRPTASACVLAAICASTVQADIILGDLATSQSYYHRADGGYAMPPSEFSAGYTGSSSLSTRFHNEFTYYAGELPSGEILFSHHEATSTITDAAGLANADVFRMSSFSMVRHNLPGLYHTLGATSTQEFTVSETGQYGFLYDAATSFPETELHFALRQLPAGTWDEFAAVSSGRGEATRPLTAGVPYEIYFDFHRDPSGYIGNGFSHAQVLMYTITPSPGGALLPLAFALHITRRRR